MKKLILFLLLCSTTTLFAQAKQTNALDTLLTRYANSINAADSALGKKFWSQDAEVSFINPLGNEYGWNGVRNIYALFSKSFSKRKLQYANTRWTNYGDFAWVTFNWVFDATVAGNNKAMQTKGHETQFWKKVNGEWKLVHVHYSGMPVAGQGQGF